MTGIQQVKVDKLIENDHYKFFQTCENVIKLKKVENNQTKLAYIDKLGRITYFVGERNDH